MSARDVLPSARNLRLVRALLGVATLVLLVLATVVLLPSAGILLFIGGLAALVAFPFAVVAGVVDGLDPAQ
ncbi:hypothetical protein [Halorarius litoreus]|uniref:hypothetical protein n=1 Tax=Halorarius litoreus TaxID=2962676 RepID=UPI0020CF564E|nr:hypothetical protein [Halorarius litoreus]